MFSKIWKVTLQRSNFPISYTCSPRIHTHNLLTQPITEYCLMTGKDIFNVFQGSEFSNAFPSVAHHVADDLWLNGVAPLVYF